MSVPLRYHNPTELVLLWHQHTPELVPTPPVPVPKNQQHGTAIPGLCQLAQARCRANWAMGLRVGAYAD
eukprot:2879702-Rhodomonas_salina.1